MCDLRQIFCAEPCNIVNYIGMTAILIVVIDLFAEISYYYRNTLIINPIMQVAHHKVAQRQIAPP